MNKNCARMMAARDIQEWLRENGFFTEKSTDEKWFLTAWDVVSDPEATRMNRQLGVHAINHYVSLLEAPPRYSDNLERIKSAVGHDEALRYKYRYLDGRLPSYEEALDEHAKHMAMRERLLDGSLDT